LSMLILTAAFSWNFSAEIFFSTKSLFFSTILTLHFLAKLLHFTNENTKAQNYIFVCSLKFNLFVTLIWSTLVPITQFCIVRGPSGILPSLWPLCGFPLAISMASFPQIPHHPYMPRSFQTQNITLLLLLWPLTCLHGLLSMG
jgi:hypothetical protein